MYDMAHSSHVRTNNDHNDILVLWKHYEPIAILHLLYIWDIFNYMSHVVDSLINQHFQMTFTINCKLKKRSEASNLRNLPRRYVHSKQRTCIMTKSITTNITTLTAF